MSSNLRKLITLLLVLSSMAFVSSCEKKTAKQVIDELNNGNGEDGGVNGNLPKPFPDIVTYLNQITNPPLADCNCSEDSTANLGTTKISGIVLDSSGNPLEDVEVRVLKQYVKTGPDGTYEITNISGNRSIVVNYFHKDFMTSSRILFAAVDTDNYIEQKLKNVDTKKTFEKGAEISLLSSENALLQINPGIQMKKDGDFYQGKVEAALSYLKLNDIESIKRFLGLYKGQDFNGQDLPFVSYGMINFELKGEDGLKVDLGDGEVATITFPASPQTGTDEIIPVFSYDYHKGQWKEEGSAERLENGEFRANVSHPGVFSLSKPAELAPGTEYTSRIIDPEGNPLPNIEVMAVGRSGWMNKDLTTDDDGRFELRDMVPDEPFKLHAYTKDGRFSASYDKDMSGMDVGEFRESEK